MTENDEFEELNAKNEHILSGSWPFVHLTKSAHFSPIHSLNERVY